MLVQILILDSAMHNAVEVEVVVGGAGIGSVYTVPAPSVHQPAGPRPQQSWINHRSVQYVSLPFCMCVACKSSKKEAHTQGNNRKPMQ